jgi:hypothetical protein
VIICISKYIYKLLLSVWGDVCVLKKRKDEDWAVVLVWPVQEDVGWLLSRRKERIGRREKSLCVLQIVSK